MKDCGVLNLLEPGDGVMADRGFDITEHAEEKGLFLTTPLFLEGQSQVLASGTTRTRSTANLRIHVERAIRRKKVFRILSNVFPLSRAPSMEHIWIIMCTSHQLPASLSCS